MRLEKESNYVIKGVGFSSGQIGKMQC